MMNKDARKKSIIRRAVLYTIITTATVVITILLGLYTFGFRFDMSLNKVEQTGLVQFGSSPSGATAKVNDRAVQLRTPNKATVNAGQHDFSIERKDYLTWNKSVTIKPGMIMWLNYAILVPNKIETESVLQFDSLTALKATPEKKDIMILRNETLANFELIDIRGSEVKSKSIDLPAEVYSEPANPDVSHRFVMTDWDDGGRYLLVRHYFGEANEWLVLDTQDPAASKNLTNHFDLIMSTVKFADTSGNKFYILNNSDVRKLDLSSSTISHPIVTDVESFIMYAKNYLAYVGQSGDGEKARRVVGVYRDGDKTAHIVKSFGIDQRDIKVAVTKYFNEDYLAITNDRVLTLMKGNFPTDATGSSALKNVMTLSLDWLPTEISFGDSGQYLMMRSGNNEFTSYDLEYQDVAKFDLGGVSGSTVNTNWLDDTHLWAVVNGQLSIREFDGQNANEIIGGVANFDAVFTTNNKYIYTIAGKSDGTYLLQRSLMILR